VVEALAGKRLGPVLSGATTSADVAAPEAVRDDDYVAACLSLIAPRELPPSKPAPVIMRRALPKVEEQRSAPPEEVRAPTAPATKRLLARARLLMRRMFARRAYRPGLDAGRDLMEHVGSIARKYVLARDPDSFNQRWMALEHLHKGGHFTGAFGHAVHAGTPEVMSKLIAGRVEVQALESQVKRIGRDLTMPDGSVLAVKPAEISLAIGVSGMSFPQLSAPSVLALLYAHVRMAKEGVRFLLNTGEGGPNFHLALLRGDEEALRNEVIAWGMKTGEIEAGSNTHARVEEFIRRLMRERDKLFGDLSPEDVEKAQLVAQFGTALNGIRGADGRIDFRKLSDLGESPHVAMVEYKLKQAAKRGSRVDVTKMEHITAAMREVGSKERVKSPTISPEMESYEDIATLVIATKVATKKPVSLKFAVGDVENIYEFLEYLARMDALPDHMQIDGSGGSISPGTGNAPPTGAAGNSSLAAREAMIAVDSILKHLGVRDEVHISVAGEMMMPTDAVEAMALGADGVMGARTWMAMGLGCAKVGACNTGACPYGIASKSGSVFADSLDPSVIGPKAFDAGMEWRNHLLVSMNETGAMDWRSFRKTHGLHARHTTLRIRDGETQVNLRDYYGEEKTRSILGDIMTPQEIDRVVYSDRPPEYEAYEYFDAARRLAHFLDGILTTDPKLAEEVDHFRDQRLRDLETFLSVARTGPEIRDFIRSEIPPALVESGVRMLRPDGWKHPQLRVVT
jgi:glutamate synthase domain-containing protein 2